MTGTVSEILKWLVAHIHDIDPNKLFDLKEHKEKRSLSQNSYYWQLVNQVAAKMKNPTSVIHNYMLRDYSVPQMFDDKPLRVIVPDTEQAARKALYSTTTHLKPTSQTKVGTDGVVYRTHVLLKGSSEMNTAEMSRLLDGIIEEAKAQGIETLPPHELERIRQFEREREARKGNSDTALGEKASA